MDDKKLKNILEAGLLVAARTLSLAQLEALFQSDAEKPNRKQIRAALDSLKEDYQGRGIELVEVASGYRLQSHESVAGWVSNLFQEKTPRYSRALLETLVLIAYRQPITRAEIEDVRGVAVSSNIIKTLLERQWVKVLGHKEVPGRPALLGTTKEFLDYFNLKKLDELPALADIKDLDQFDELLAEEIGEVGEQGDAANDAGGEDQSPAQNAENVADNTSDIQNPNDTDAATSEISANKAQQQTEANRIQQIGAMLDLGESDESADQMPDSEIDATDNGESVEEIDANQSMSGAELKLLRVIAEFSEEHQQQVDARDELESGIVSPEGNDVDETDLGDLSQRIGDDNQPGGMPDPGDTLH